ncbi:YlmH/Sll1252 family protein [Lactobacillus sp. ESL0731]|uniref:YlmH family RNA-binding protein n=1 Tax=unclassified Lactobacillus TaxID=2620435 RepID=UPI0023F849AF|nr:MULTISPECIES: YlmH/Sll1252 family protein [unclassified Lactobacillus]WEV51931.1 YlmH/Sll1252 family protein [Lactobacillus sp. ESL0700]WEV63062.1 YlmH/Sll1252 family protein [Lactobacillus sp. ESL0731]
MMKRQASSFYPHFDSEEKSTVDKMVGFFNQVIFKHEAILTDFLDPAQRDILKTVAGGDLLVQEFGGYTDAEKKRVYLSEDWVNLMPADYQVTACEIYYPSKFTQLTHSSILGTLANSGVETDTFGDIITDGAGKWQFFIKTELLDFFTQQIDRIGHTQVKVRSVLPKEILVPEDDSQIVPLIVASLRIDAVLAGISKNSRGQLKDAINANLVKLNWHGVKDSNIIVKVGDVLSLRHFGRSQIMDITTTKKGKYRVVLKLWQTKKHKQKD